jgi:hypothetical protein
VGVLVLGRIGRVVEGIHDGESFCVYMRGVLVSWIVDSRNELMRIFKDVVVCFIPQDSRAGDAYIR